jgi:hypothetical protein
MGVQDIIEVYDSMSASRVMRRLACHKPALKQDVRDRVAIFQEFPDLRIFTLQTDRELHREADGISKVGLPAGMGLTGEFWADRLLLGRGFVGIRPGDRIFPRLYAKGEGGGEMLKEEHRKVESLEKVLRRSTRALKER